MIKSIYQWSGSDIRNILTFRQRHPLSATVELDTSRRSRPAIFSAANAFALVNTRSTTESDEVRSRRQQQSDYLLVC
jgi:superfamily I DNA/RNA helicase